MFSMSNSDSNSRANEATNAEWEIVSHEDAMGYYTDRILLVLGPGKVIYHLPTTSIRHSSLILTNIARVPPPDRHLRLPTLDHAMLNTYITLDRTESFAKDHSWSDIIKLAMTAEVLQDPIVAARAIAALKKKEELVVAGAAEPLSVEDYDVAWKFSRTGDGYWMLMTLNNIRERQDRRLTAAKLLEEKTQAAPTPVLPPSYPSHPAEHSTLAPMLFLDVWTLSQASTPFPPPPPAQAPTSLPGPTQQSVLGTATSNTPTLPDRPSYRQGGRLSKYANSTLRAKDLSPKDKADEGKWHASRQPIVPPSNEALQTGTVGNFAWPATRG